MTTASDAYERGRADERERIRRDVNSDGFQASIRAYVLEGSGADDVTDAIFDLLAGDVAASGTGGRDATDGGEPK